jgi:PAS domain S-box-containing protein
MELLLGAGHHAVAAYDTDLRLSMWSPAMEVLTGVTANQAVGALVFERFPAARLNGEFQLMRDALAGRHSRREATNVFGVLSGDDGLALEIFYFPLAGATGPVGGMVVARERGDAAHTKEELAEAETRFRTMANCAPVLLWMADTSALCVFFNQSWLEFTGRGLQEEYGYGWAEGVHPEDLESCIATFMEAFAARRTFRMMYRLRRHDGEYRWILDSGAPRYTPAGQFSGFIGSCIDITDRKRVEESLERTADELRSARDQMETLLYAASHDLREPLRMVSSYSGILSQKYGHLLDANGTKYLRYVSQGSSRMQKLVDGLMSLARVREIEARVFDLVPLREALDAALENLELSIEEGGVEVSISELPHVRGSVVYLTHLFQNILDNAIKFRKPDSCRIKISAERVGEDWVIRVHDNGIGFPQEYASKATSLFSRFHGRQDYAGSGIGLALCREIVTRHGGRLALTSSPGEGTTVSFSLLAREGTEPPAAQ